MSEDWTREEVHDIIDDLVRELLDQAGVSAPPVEVTALARHLGRTIRPVRETARQGRSRSRETGPEVQQWLIALEIGSFLKPEVLRRLGIDPQQPRPLLGETLAGLLATRLLLPTDWFADQCRVHNQDLLALKDEFSTASHEAIALRWLDLDQPCIVTILDNGEVSQRKSNGCSPGRKLSAVEKRCQDYVHQYSRPHAISEQGWHVRGWPLHEADWKREILFASNDDL